MNLEDLRAPFHSSRIHWRVGNTNRDKTKGMALAYLDARDVMERLDAVCGMGNWQDDYPWSDSKKLVCRIGIKIDGEWVWKSNGAGDTNFEADKGAFSDAFKRAAVLWGIGQYLYGCPNWWGELEGGKRFTDAAQTKLNKDYEAWLISSEGPLKSLVERQRILSKHLGPVQAVKEGIATGDLSTAAEEWFTLPEEVQYALMFAPSRGGIFDPQEIQVMRSKEFRLAYFGEEAA